MAISTDSETPWSPEAFHQRLLDRRRFYHTEHPFQVLMTSGRLNRRQLQGWVANRFYYQIHIPRKDAAILANCDDRRFRRRWIERIRHHDGDGTHGGGIEAWLTLGEAVGLTRREMESLSLVLPGVRFSVDAYVRFCRDAPWPEAVCSSLTELFASEAHADRLRAFPRHYPWVRPEGLRYFADRLEQTPRDCALALSVTLERFRTRREQDRALEILQFKLDVLWALLDAVHLHYVLGEERHESESLEARGSPPAHLGPPSPVGARSRSPRSAVPGGNGPAERDGGGHSESV